MSDPRLADYRYLGMVGRCFSLRLMDADNRVWGIFSPFDMINRSMPVGELQLLRKVPALFRPLL